MAEHEWYAEVRIKPNPELYKNMTHMPAVVAQLAQIGADVAGRAAAGHKEATYGVIVQNQSHTKRARALVHPTNNAGIHVELTQHSMLKAAIGNTNKTISKPASSAAQTMGAKDGDSAATVSPGGAMTPTTVTPTR